MRLSPQRRRGRSARALRRRTTCRWRPSWMPASANGCTAASTMPAIVLESLGDAYDLSQCQDPVLVERGIDVARSWLVAPGVLPEPRLSALGTSDRKPANILWTARSAVWSTSRTAASVIRRTRWPTTSSTIAGRLPGVFNRTDPGRRGRTFPGAAGSSACVPPVVGNLLAGDVPARKRWLPPQPAGHHRAPGGAPAGADPDIRRLTRSRSGLRDPLWTTGSERASLSVVSG